MDTQFGSYEDVDFISVVDVYLSTVAKIREIFNWAGSSMCFPYSFHAVKRQKHILIFS